MMNMEKQLITQFPALRNNIPPDASLLIGNCERQTDL